MISQTARPSMNDLIRAAFERGYTVDHEGSIYNAQGIKLATRLGNTTGRLQVRLPHPTRRQFAVDAARVVAYSVFGEAVFSPAVGVGFRDGNKLNLRQQNIILMKAAPHSQPPRRRIVPFGLRTRLSLLVMELADLIELHASLDGDESDPFTVDENERTILHELIDFLTQHRAGAVRADQLTVEHAAAWWSLNVRRAMVGDILFTDGSEGE